MGSKSLSNQRIKLWRRALYLIRVHKNIVGPFVESGLDQYEIESIVKYNGEVHNPDMVIWSSKNITEYFAIVELTLDVTSKTNQLEKYAAISPNAFRIMGIQSEVNPIVILMDMTYLENHENFCQIVLKDELQIHNIDRIPYKQLKDSLKSKEGIDLVHIPESQFTMVPECKNKELKESMCDCIMRQFRPGNLKFTAEDIVRDATDYIYDKISVKKRKNLINRVNNQLNSLVSTQLKEYIFQDKGEYILTEKGKNVAISKNVASREAIQKILTKWKNDSNGNIFDFLPHET